MADVVNFYEARARLRPFAWTSDLWLQSCFTVAIREPKWRSTVADLRAEVRRREQRKGRPI